METTPAVSPPPPHADAVDLLMRHYRHLDLMLSELGQVADAAAQWDIVHAFGREFDVVATVEDRFFYRRVQRAIPGLGIAVRRARRELVEIYRYFHLLKEARPSDAVFRTCLQSLRESVRQHSRRNAIDVYPATRQSSLDLKSLSDSMEVRAHELRAAGARCPFPLGMHSRPD